MTETPSIEAQRQERFRKELQASVVRSFLKKILTFDDAGLDSWTAYLATSTGQAETLAMIKQRWPVVNTMPYSTGSNRTFVLQGTPPEDINLFLGPIDDADIIESFDAAAMMADLVVMAGKFPSKGQARKNGWDMAVPPGYSNYTIGKGKNRLDIYVLNAI